MALLSKSSILQAADLQHEDLPMPQWGGTVRVRTMTGQERDEFRMAVSAEGGVPVGQFNAALLLVTLVDEAGERLFTPDDMAALQKKNAATLDRLALVAVRLNGLGGQAVEGAVKNSSSGQSDDSGSDSPRS